MANLPKYIDFQSFTTEHQTVSGALDIADMKTLADLIENDDGKVELTIDYFLNDHYKKMLTGKFNVDLPLACQRCLETFDYKLNTDFEMVVIHDEAENESLPKNVDVYVSQYFDKVDILECIEEELILGIPHFPSHDSDQCGATEIINAQNKVNEAEETQKNNPFDVLVKLKKDD